MFQQPNVIFKEKNITFTTDLKFLAPKITSCQS